MEFLVEFALSPPPKKESIFWCVDVDPRLCFLSEVHDSADLHVRVHSVVFVAVEESIDTPYLQEIYWVNVLLVTMF